MSSSRRSSGGKSGNTADKCSRALARLRSPVSAALLLALAAEKCLTASQASGLVASIAGIGVEPRRIAAYLGYLARRGLAVRKPPFYCATRQLLELVNQCSNYIAKVIAQGV